MKGLIAIIEALSSDEKRDFLVQLQRKNRRTDTKNLKLFKLIDAGKTDNLDIVLYGKVAKNSFHALCKRLQDNLIDFVASRSFDGETSEELEILKLLLASRIFFEKNQNRIAVKTLEKAEKFAKQTDVYSILNEIYHTKIQYAHLNAKDSLKESISASEENMKLYQQDFQLNRAYAVIKSALKSRSDLSVHEIIHDVFVKYGITINTDLTYKSLFQLMEITVEAAKLQSDYYTFSPFIMELYEVVSRKGIVKEKHRYYHISILNLLAVTNFRNKRFDLSIEFCRKMESEMKMDKGVFYKQFLNKLVIVKALNYNYTGKAQVAIALLNTYKSESLDVRILLVMCYFQQNAYSDAYETIMKLNHSDVWYEKKMGWVWVLKKSILEILILIELDKLDLVLLRLLSFKRKFTVKLKKMGELRVLTFMSLVTRYYENPNEVTTEKFHVEVERSFSWIGKEQEDIFVMSFYAWLKAKMLNKEMYKVTLQMVANTED